MDDSDGVVAFPFTVLQKELDNDVGFCIGYYCHNSLAREYAMKSKVITSMVVSIVIVVGIIGSLLPAGGLVMD
jgi:hypothetical protein